MHADGSSALTHTHFACVALDNIRAIAENSSDVAVKRAFHDTIALPACNPVCIGMLLEGTRGVGVIMFHKGA